MLEERRERSQVRQVRREQPFPDAPLLSVAGHPVLELELHGLEKDPSRERVAIGVQARRGQAEEHVAGAHARPVEDLPAIDDPDDEADQLVVPDLIEAGHLRGLAAEQSTAILAAPIRDTGYERDQLVGLELARADVVEKEERTRALHQDIVDAVIDEIPADGGEVTRHPRHGKLGTDAIGRGHQHRLGQAFEVRSEQAAEEAEIREDTVGKRAPGERLDLREAAFLGVDVDPRGGVSALVLPLVAHVGRMLSRPDRRRARRASSFPS